MQQPSSNSFPQPTGMLLSPQGNTQGLSLFDLADSQSSQLYIPGLTDGVDLEELSQRPTRLREKMMEMIEAVDDCESCAWYTYRLGLKPTQARLQADPSRRPLAPERMQYLAARAWQISKMNKPPVRTLGCDCCDTRVGLRLASARPAVARCISELTRGDKPMRSRLVAVRDKALYVADLNLFGYRSIPGYERALASDAKRLVMKCKDRFSFLDAAHRILERIQPDESRQAVLSPVLPYLAAWSDNPRLPVTAHSGRLAQVEQALRFLSERADVLVSVREQLAEVISHRQLPSELGDRYVLDRVPLFAYTFLSLCPASDNNTLADQARHTLVDYIDRVELLEHMNNQVPKQSQKRQWPDELLSRVMMALPAMIDDSFQILGRSEKKAMNDAKKEGRRYDPSLRRATPQSRRRRIWSQVVNPYVKRFAYKQKPASE